MSSSESSDASPSPQASPIASYHGPPDLERLLGHFVAAKRALTHSQYVERANQLVTGSRALVEDIAITECRNVFANSKIHQQVNILHAIRDRISTTGNDVDDEFSVAITNLDAANDKLQKSLSILKATTVDAAIHRAKEEEVEVDDDSSDAPATVTKTLYDFVDESQYETLSNSLRTLIDTFHDSRHGLETTLDNFRDSINNVAQVIAGRSAPDSPSKAGLFDDPKLPIPQLFDHMEEHAGEMAGLLQSLVSHYDLCVSALKHTEGGREAAQKVAARSDIEDENERDGSLYKDKIAEPISNAERNEMLRVLEGDAEQLEDVLQDLKERGAEMDRLYNQLASRDDRAKRESEAVREAIRDLYQIRSALPEYVEEASKFREEWSDMHQSINEKTQEIVGLRSFYEQFSTGYKKLLREIDRRKAIDAQMRTIANRAQQDLDRLYLADREAREDFFDDVGSFLPSDLWPGVAEEGLRWNVSAASPATEETATEEQLRRPV